MFKAILKRLQGGKEKSVESRARVEKHNNLQDEYDSQVEAMAMAEAGAHEMARAAVAYGRMERSKILVVGKEDTFTQSVVDYAINMAERLGYDIVAMNVSTVMGHTGNFLSPFKKHLREEFEKRSVEAVEPLQQQSMEKQIQCDHVVRFGPLRRAVEDLHQEIKHIEFVITEPEAHPDSAEAEVTIPVFSLQY